MKFNRFLLRFLVVLGAIACFYSQSFSAIGGDGKNYPVDLSAQNFNRLIKKNLTWGIPSGSFATPLTSVQTFQMIQMGCAIWSSICQISFTYTTNPNPDIPVNITDLGTDVGGDAYANHTGGQLNINSEGPWTGNVLLACVVHELGHILGMIDQRSPNGDPPPHPASDYPDQSYYNWRMSFTIPKGPYNVLNDTHISEMDYDGFKPWWGNTPENVYLSQYDVEFVQTVYGTPSNYKPLIFMQLGQSTTDANLTSNSGSFVTTSWDLASSMCRQYIGADVRYFYLVSNTSGTGKTGYWRYYNPTTHDYCVSSAASKSGWVQQEQLGYWWTASGNKDLSIGGISTPCQSLPIYQYTNNGLHWAGPKVMSGWTNCTGDEILNTYVVNSTELTKVLDPAKYYKIISTANTSYALDVNGTLGNGSSVITYLYGSGSDNMRWQFVDIGGYYKIVSKVNPAYGLNIWGGHIANGVIVKMNTYAGGNNEKWQIIDAGSGNYKIASTNTSFILGSTSFVPSNGKTVEIDQDVNNVGQFWQISEDGAVNLAVNPGFEQGATVGWAVAGNTPKAYYTEKPAGGAHSGSYQGTHYSSSGAYTVNTTQKFTGLSNGAYTVSAWVKSSGGQTSAYLGAQSYGSTSSMTYAINSKISSWTQISISNIPVTNNSCTIGFWSTANKGNSIYFDDVVFSKQ